MEEHQFIQTVERHRGAIERVCRSFCRDADMLDDLRQDVLMNLWRGWKKYHPEGHTVTWVWRVAVNTAISWQRRRRRQVPTVPIEGYDCPDDMKTENELLQELIARLSDSDRRLVCLYLDGWTAREIGCMTGMRESNVTTRIARIKEKLKKKAI